MYQFLSTAKDLNFARVDKQRYYVGHVEHVIIRVEYIAGKDMAVYHTIYATSTCKEMAPFDLKAEANSAFMGYAEFVHSNDKKVSIS